MQLGSRMHFSKGSSNNSETPGFGEILLMVSESLIMRFDFCFIDLFCFEATEKVVTLSRSLGGPDW